MGIPHKSRSIVVATRRGHVIVFIPMCRFVESPDANPYLPHLDSLTVSLAVIFLTHSTFFRLVSQPSFAHSSLLVLMSAQRAIPSSKQPRQRRKLTEQKDMSRGAKLDAMTTSLNSIQIQPRTPRSSRPGRDWASGSDGGTDEVELTLLNEDERREAGAGVDGFGLESGAEKAKSTLTAEDKKAMVLLSILCSSFFMRFSPPRHLNLHNIM